MRRVGVSDHPIVAGWYEARSEPVPTDDMYPEFGLIVDGVAAGFLYMTDSRMCLIEGYISNPKASPEVRHLAITQITVGLLERAKEVGATTIVAITGDSGIWQRAIRDHGFNDIGSYRLLVRREN